MTLYALVMMSLAAPAALAQAPAQAAKPAPVTPMTPSDPHDRLTFFEGSWTYEEAAPDMQFRETCGWMPSGRRHMVCAARRQTTSGPREGTSIFSYRAADKTYIYQGFRAGGAVQSLEGRVSDDGKTWEFWGEDGTGAMRTRTRVRIVKLESGRFRFSEQTAVGPGDWSPESVVNYRAAR
ncbi:MAG: DUF1579 domain-containing protein [Acidobacteriota bacterium]|nr:DUF1579 domain-containing protein [Acidobacteriota bacterium]